MTERAVASQEALEKAVLLDPELKNDILLADGLAFTRLQPAFKAFTDKHYL